MMVLLHATGEFPGMQFLAPEWRDARVVFVDHLQDFTSQLYRNPDALGLLHCHLPDLAPQIVRGLRDGDITSRLIVLLRGRETEALNVHARASTLMAGADDAQPETIDPRELVARLRALSARDNYIDHLTIRLPGAVFRFADSCFEADGGRLVHISPKLCQIMVDLGRRPGQTRTKQQIMDALYGDDDGPEIKIVDVLICKLRRKVVEATGGLDVIQTVWGRGYQFVSEGFLPECGVGRVRAAP